MDDLILIIELLANSRESSKLKSLEEMLKGKEEVLVRLDYNKKGVTIYVEADGKRLYTTELFSYVESLHVIRLKLKKKKTFPLQLTAVDVNLGVVKARFEKKKEN